MATLDVLGAVALGGLMGMVGQGARAVVGLKKLREEAAVSAPGQGDTFMASRLFVSLMIGFIAGIAASITLGVKQLIDISPDDLSILMGIAAAGYAGTDAIEGFTSRFARPAAAATIAAESPGSAASTGQETATLDTADIEASMVQVQDDVAGLKSMILDAQPLLLAAATQKVGDFLDKVTVADVKKMFVPETPSSNIIKHLPNVLAGLRHFSLTDRDMLLMALSTIRAESEGFVPISEFKSKFNTSKTPFDLYEPGTSAGKRVGNKFAGDGSKYKGRGFVQLTGRFNYGEIGSQLSMNLIDSPELANDSVKAGLILAKFLKNKEGAIRSALKSNQLAKARELVNGGSHGLVQFKDAFQKGSAIFAEDGTLEV